MIIIISPSKTLDFPEEISGKYFKPELLEYSLKLIHGLRKLSPAKICKLMDISEKLGELNYQRYQEFSADFTLQNSHPALFAFKGDVYTGLRAGDFSNTDIQYAQNHLRILSGLYGCLRPLDLIQPYRLEMGTKLANKTGNNLYKFWGNIITAKLNTLIQETNSSSLINLASNEYFKAVNTKLLKANIITPIFKEKKGNSYKIVMLYAKRARGMMAAYLLKNRVENVADIKNFNEDSYNFNAEFSTDTELVFVR